VKAVVNCMADGKYQDIPRYAEFEVDTVESFQESAEGYLKINELSHFDRYGVPCSFHVQYQNGTQYQQFEIYLGKKAEKSNFSVCYDLTTDGDLNDLTLLMDFLFQEDGSLKAVITDIHVM